MIEKEESAVTLGLYSCEEGGSRFIGFRILSFADWFRILGGKWRKKMLFQTLQLWRRKNGQRTKLICITEQTFVYTSIVEVTRLLSVVISSALFPPFRLELASPVFKQPVSWLNSNIYAHFFSYFSQFSNRTCKKRNTEYQDSLWRFMNCFSCLRLIF